MAINYTPVTFNATFSAQIASIGDFTNPTLATGTPDASFAFRQITSGASTSQIYASGFRTLSIPASANIASGFMVLTHRQPSGTQGDGKVGQMFAGIALGESPFSTPLVPITPTGATFTTYSGALPASVLTPSVLNNPLFYIGLNYINQGAGTLSIDLDTIQLVIVYDQGGTPFYKTTSLFRNGANFYKQ